MRADSSTREHFWRAVSAVCGRWSGPDRAVLLLCCGILRMGVSDAAGPAAVASTDVDEQAIGLYQQDASQWLSNGRTHAEQRYSPLKQIDARNLSRLGLAWEASLESPMFGVESTPLVVGGVLYTTSSYSRAAGWRPGRTGSSWPPMTVA